VDVSDDGTATAAMHDIERLIRIRGTDDRESGLFEAQSELLDVIGFVIEDANWEISAMRSCERFFESRHGKM